MLFWLLACSGSLDPYNLGSPVDSPPPLDAPTPVPESWPNDESPLGVNLAPVAPWMSQWAFTDAMHASSEWVPQRASDDVWNTGEPLDVGPDGWIRSLAPDQQAATIVYVDVDGHYPEGLWNLSWEGTGRIRVRGDGWAVLDSPGAVDIHPTGAGIVVVLEQTDPADPVRNLSLHMPGFDDDRMFHPFFLDKLSTFKTLRFMDWQHTNGSAQVSWSDHPEMHDRRWTTGAGVPVEVMVELANTLHADPWFCIPHEASDGWVQRFFEVVRDDLDPDLTVYVEYSNEVWNGGFEQGTWVEQQGLAQGLHDNPFTARLAAQADRSLEIFAIAEDMMGLERSQVRVLGSQHANPWVTETLLSFVPPGSVDAVAIAPYFGHHLTQPDGPDLASMDAAALADTVFAEVPWAVARIEEHAAITDAAGVQLLAYEGGQHLVATGDPNLAMRFKGINQSPAMKDAYLELLEGFEGAGGTHFVAFNFTERWTEWGSWGALEFQDTDRAWAPKYDALLSFIESRQR